MSDDDAGFAWQTGVWDRISQLYWHEIDPRFAPVVEGVIGRASLRQGDRVLDLGTGTGSTFDARPSPTPRTDAPFSRFGELNALPPNTAPYEATNGGLTKFPFQYPVGNPVPTWQYRFRRTLQFNARGDSRINSTYDNRRVVEVGLLQTHGTATPPPRSGGGTPFVTWDGNVVAVQINGFAGDVRIFRR